MAWRDYIDNTSSVALGIGMAVVLIPLSFSRSLHPTWCGFCLGFGSNLLGLGLIRVAKQYFAPDREPRPLLRVSALIPAEVQRDGLIWRRQHDGHPAVLAVVTNRAAINKKIGGSERGIAASIQFEDYLGPQHFVQRGYWVNSVISTTDMPVGTERMLLIGMRVDDKWVAFTNEHEIDPKSIPGNEGVNFSAMPRRLPFSESMQVTINIYSEETGVVFDTCTLPIPGPHEIVNRN